MTINPRRLTMALMAVLTTALFAFFILFDAYAWGKYVFFAISASIFLLSTIANHGKIRLFFDAYVFLNLAIIAFAYFSSLWAIDASDTVVMAGTLVKTFVCAYIVYVAYSNMDGLSMTMLLKTIMWAGYFVAIYSLVFYGFDKLIIAGSASSLRVDNEFANANLIGLMCALSCVIQANIKIIEPKTRLFPSALFAIPSLIVIAATQSRKALVFLIVGLLGAACVSAQKSGRDTIKKTAKIVFGVFAVAGILYLVLQLDIFSGIRERVQTSLNFITGTGKIDSSTILRNQFKKLGFEWFLKYPVGGVGIGNTHILAARYCGVDTYLHNNFVELLCGGGIVGFCLYYATYIYLFCQLWRYRDVDRQRVVFFAIWLGIMLAMNYGMVTYYSKSESFYLMLHFVNILDLKRKAVKQCISEDISKQ